MAVSIDKQTFTLQFQKKVTLELAVLNQKLSHQLRHEIAQAFEQSLYTDLEVSVNGGGVGGGGGGGLGSIVRTHSCIVQSRAPKFYSKVCASRRSVVLPERADRHSIEAFFRTLYWCNDVSQEENDILKQLGNLKRLYQQQQVATPESDVYLTPQASPSEAHSGGGCSNQRFSGNFVLDDSCTSSHLDRHKNNAALYYSLVPIDEVFDSDCSTGGVLEKELAEQDQLFKSFKSILNKEQRSNIFTPRTKKRTKPTSLSLTSSLNPKHYATNINDSLQRIYSKRKLDSKQEVKSGRGGAGKKKYSGDEEEAKSTNCDSSLNNNNSNNCSRNVQIPSLDVEQSSSGGGGNMNKVASKVVESGGSKGECDDTTMSNPETEVEVEVEVVSSGYVTGSSPRDHTVSMSEETFGVDVTEAASSEDLMPHDNDVRGGGGASSSSVSSDGGTWDTTPFPASAICPPVNLPDLVQIENNLNAVDLFEPAATRPKNGGINTPSFENHSQDKQIESNVEKIASRSSRSPDKSDHNNHCAASKNNFFIDASSLLDESELANLQVATSLTYNSSCQSGDTCCDVVVDCYEEKKKAESVVACNKGEIVNGVNGFGIVAADKKPELSPSSELTFEERRSSLIRRNTFELEADDGTGKKLAKLQQEFEKSKDAVENNCIKGHVKKPQSPDSLLIVAKNLHSQVTKQDDEMHSPDSLNNDAPLEVMFEDRNEEEKRRILGKVNQEKTNSQEDSSNEYEASKLYNSGLFYNVENTLDQCFKYDSTKLHCDKDDSSVNENGGGGGGGSSRMSDCSSTLSRSSACVGGSVDRLNRIESMPIVSGGASISDFSPPVSCASPLARRKTEMAPILSGGSVLMPETNQKICPKPKASSAFTASWVVDMSDAVKSPEMRKKKRSDSARSSGSSDDLSKSDAAKSPAMKTSNPALGFFIPLDDPKLDKVAKEKLTESQDSKSGSQNNINQSCGFFIDLTTKQADKKDRPVEKNVIPPDKKLFSMFIDISETSSTENVSPKSKTSSPNLFANKKLKPKTMTHASRFHSKHDDLRSSDSQLSSESSIELAVEHPEVARGKHLFSDQLNCTPPPSRQISTNENSTVDLSSSQHESRKKGFFMFIEAENSSPVPRRRTLPSGLRPNSQRHSWNLDTNNGKSCGGAATNQGEVKKEHKRAHSVSVDRTLTASFSVANCDEKKLSSSVSSLVKSNTTNKEFNSIVLDSGPASIDEATMQRNSRAMTASWHGPVKPSTELQKVLARKELRESKTMLGLSSSQNSSLVLNKQQNGDNNHSETSLSCDETYDLRTDSVVSDLSSSCCSRKGGNNSTFIVEDVSNVANAATSNGMELSTPSHELAASELSNDGDDTSAELLATAAAKKLQTVKEESSKSFVKLSDMDKDPPPVKLVSTRKSMTSSMTHRMSRSIPEAGSWLENRLMTRSATSRSLGRLFPHLQVRSPTADREREREDTTNYAATDVSEMSSMQSSMEPSALEGSTTTDEGSVTGGNACSRLGEDLLRMFVEEISCDVVVEVGGRRLKAHKCILASRCQYFAAMLSGGWVESAGDVISLQGFSYNAVHFALCHIYSGTSNIPDSINIVELATLADMLCLEGLKEVIMYTLKVKYCHFFHKPCPLCTVGVLECLPLAAAYGLDEIYRKSLRWISKHFVRVWPTKGFATLPRELIDKCLKQHVVHMSVENVLDTVMCCEKLEATIPQVRWADPVFAVTQRLHETAVKFITQHFSGVLASEMFLSFGKDSTWNLERVKKTLLGAVDKGLSPDQACRSLSRLHTILAVADAAAPPSPSADSAPPPTTQMIWSHEFVVLLRDVAAACESCVVKQATRAVRSSGWLQLDTALRQRIQQAACLVIVPGDERRRARMHHSLQRRSEDRSSSCSSSGLRSSDLHQVKVVMSQQNVGARKPASDSTATAPVAAAAAGTKTLSNRASVPQTTNTNTSSKSSARSDENATKTKSWPHRLAEVKSRYMEQRAPLKTTTVTSIKTNNNNSSNSVTSSSSSKCWSVPAQRKGNLGKAIISSSDSSRTSSPAMRRSLGTRTLFATQQQQQQQQQRKQSETLSMSTDSLIEAAASKQVKSEPVEVNGNVRARTTKKSVAAAAATTSKTKSAESLLASRSLASNNGNTAAAAAARDRDRDRDRETREVKLNHNNKGSSPLPLTRRTPNSQTSPRVFTRASPKSQAVCSPGGARRNTGAAGQPNKDATSVKRNATYRVVQQQQQQQQQHPTPTPPTKMAAAKPKVNNNNNNNNNNNQQRKAAIVNNNCSASSPLLNRVKQQHQPGVGSRSGTFLKDEPTVLAKQQPTTGGGQ